jgi:hypothetical protein
MEIRVLSMELHSGDRITDERGEWEIISRPYVSAGGTLVSAQVRRVDDRAATDLRTWEAHDWVVVRRRLPDTVDRREPGRRKRLHLIEDD